MKKHSAFFLAFFCTTLPQVLLSQSTPITITVDKKYLCIPLAVDETITPANVSASINGANLFNAPMRFADGPQQWWANLDVTQFMGKSLTLSNIPQKSASLVQLSNFIIGHDSLYFESNRPQVHFSYRMGVLGDPTAKFYYAPKDEWHMFFIYNPFRGKEVSWGHAVSKDLLHWEERPPIFQYGYRIFNGTGFVDTKNHLGLNQNGHQAIVLLQTHVERPGGAFSYVISIDGGISFKSVDDVRASLNRPDLPVNPLAPDWHDAPRIYWSDKHQRYVLYLKKAFRVVNQYLSSDLKSWQQVADVPAIPESFTHEGDPGELVDMYLDGDTSKMFTVAMFGLHGYIVGHYGENGMLNLVGEPIDKDDMVLTAHFGYPTIFQNPKNGRIIMNQNLGNNGAGGIPNYEIAYRPDASMPVELSLKSTPQGPRLFFNPIAELNTLYKTTHSFGSQNITSNTWALWGLKGRAFRVVAKITPAGARQFGFDICGSKLTYDTQYKMLSVDEAANNATTSRKRRSLQPSNGSIELDIIVDVSSLEVFANKGEVHIPHGHQNYYQKPEGAISIFSVDGAIKVDTVVVYELYPVWATPFHSDPHEVPGKIQAEDYDIGGKGVSYFNAGIGSSGVNYRSDDAGLSLAIDTGAGYALGLKTPGGWLKYSLNVIHAGKYKFEARIAAEGQGGDFFLRFSNTGLTDSIAVPNTHGAQNWLTINKEITLVAGRQELKISTNSGGLYLNWFRLALANGTAPKLGFIKPLRNDTLYEGANVEVSISAIGNGALENVLLYIGSIFIGQKNAPPYQWNINGPKVPLLSNMPEGNYMLKAVAIDTYGCSTTALMPIKVISSSIKVDDRDTLCKYSGNWTTANSNIYYLTTCMVSKATGAYVEFGFNGTEIEWYGLKNKDLGFANIFIDGKLVAANIDCYAPSAFVTSLFAKTGLSDSLHTIKLVMAGTKNSSSSNIYLVHDYFKFRRVIENTPQVQKPFGSIPVKIPGTIQAETFDLGGEGIAYHDASKGNSGNNYRMADDVDIFLNNEGGYSIYNTQAGEWLEYTVFIDSAATYTLNARVSSITEGGTFRIEWDSANVSGDIPIPLTGTGQNWAIISRNMVLEKGQKIMRVVISEGNIGLDYLIFSYYKPVGLAFVDPRQAQITIFPNPAHDLINIHFNQLASSLKTITLFDVSGRPIISEKNSGADYSMVLTNIKPGCYTLYVCNKEARFAQKIMVY